MLEFDKQTIIDDGLFSTKCILYNPDGRIQGKGATLSLNDANFNPQDSLYCFSPFIGLDISTDTGLGIFADRAEITLNMSSVKIGIVEKGWIIEVYFPSIRKWQKFKCEFVAIDRMMGIYLIKPSLVEEKVGNVNNLRVGGLGEFNI